MMKRDVPTRQSPGSCARNRNRQTRMQEYSLSAMPSSRQRSPRARCLAYYFLRRPFVSKAARQNRQHRHVHSHAAPQDMATVEEAWWSQFEAAANNRRRKSARERVHFPYPLAAQLRRREWTCIAWPHSATSQPIHAHLDLRRILLAYGSTRHSCRSRSSSPSRVHMRAFARHPSHLHLNPVLMSTLPRESRRERMRLPKPRLVRMK